MKLQVQIKEQTGVLILVQAPKLQHGRKGQKSSSQARTLQQGSSSCMNIYSINHAETNSRCIEDWNDPDRYAKQRIFMLEQGL